jgi:quinol monooxygenase YgiN
VDEAGREAGEEIDLTVVVMRFKASDPAALLPILAKYVVLARGHAGCRNIDLCSSATTPSTLLMVQKWETPEAQRAHFDSPVMVEMAKACTGLLSEAPDIDLYDPISAHDLN